MALIPNALNTSAQPRGIVGTWANMEEDNARTGFAGAEFAGGVPVMLDADADVDAVFVPLEDGGRFAGIALRTVDMQGTPTEDGAATFREGDLFGIADMGTVFVLAGDDVTEGAGVFYDPTTRKYHGASAAGLLPLAGCEFDETAADGEPVALRIRLTPGAAPVAEVQ